MKSAKELIAAVNAETNAKMAELVDELRARVVGLVDAVAHGPPLSIAHLTERFGQDAIAAAVRLDLLAADEDTIESVLAQIDIREARIVFSEPGDDGPQVMTIRSSPGGPVIWSKRYRNVIELALDLSRVQALSPKSEAT